MADLLCGLSVDTKALDAAIGNIKAELNSLTSGAGGIADQIGTMKADLQAKADLALADLNKLIPDIKPELPNLQAEMSNLLAQISNPVNFSTALADIRTKFGNIPGVDIDSLVSELKSNPLNFDICSKIPNFDVEEKVDADGKTIYVEIKKGTPPKAPTVDAVKPPVPPKAKEKAAVTPSKDQTAGGTPSAESRKHIGSSQKPAAKPPATKYETTTVDWNDDWKAYIKAKKAIGKSVYSYQQNPVPFYKTTDTYKGFTNDVQWWRPMGFGYCSASQITFEKYIVGSVWLTYCTTHAHLKRIQKLDPGIVAERVSQGDLNYDEARLKDVLNLAVAFVRNGLPAADGPNGTYTRFSPTKNALDTYFEISVEQAARSAIPKPLGDFLIASNGKPLGIKV